MSPGCSTCGLPLEATDAEHCGVCLAKPPRIQRTRAAVAYDELSRSIAIRLKYGRKVALARTMARYMAPLVSKDADPILVPGAAASRRGCGSAGSTSRRSSPASCRESDRLAVGARGSCSRVKRTPPLKGMSLQPAAEGRRGRIQGRSDRRSLRGARSSWSTTC